MKNWLKNEDSQLSSENGMLIALAVIIVLVIGPFVWKAIQGGYDTGQTHEKILSPFYISAILKEKRKGGFDHETFY